MNESKVSAALHGQHIALASAKARVASAAGLPFAEVFRHGSLGVELFCPKGIDTQQPHNRDETYFVVSGSGEFRYAESRVNFGPGDFLFVPAGVAHRFENFSKDLTLWVMFYGPEGGEFAGAA